VAGVAITARACPVPPRVAGTQRMDSVRGWSARDVTVLSTVPTLAALGPAEALGAVRVV